MTINIQLVYSPEENRFDEKNQMVKLQLVARNIQNPNIIKAMRTLPRHLFVLGDNQAHAYEDRPLGIGCGQTISQPYMVAKVAELLELSGKEKVLEIGAGCGYQAAVLSFAARQVVGIEYYEELARFAEDRIKELRLSNVSIHHADGKQGWIKESPFDRILCSCSVTNVPDAWTEQMKEGGILVFPKETGSNQILCKWKKQKRGWLKEELFGVRYVPLL